MQNVTMQPNLDALQAQQVAQAQADVSAFANKGVNLEATPAADTLEITTQQQPKKKGGLGKILLAGLAIAGGVLLFKKFNNKDLAKLVKKKVTPEFTGTLKGKIGKEGKTAELLYENGFLKASKKFDKSGKELMSKTFELLDDGSKKIVTIKDGVTSVVTQAPKAV